MNAPSIERIQAHCPECNGERTCEVHGSIDKPWSYEDRQGHSVDGGVRHSLLECMGCHTVFYETSSWNSEDIDQWYDANGETQGEYVRTKVTYPKPDSRTKPRWFDDMHKVDARLHGILSEMYVAYDSELYVLTAVGLRTALDRGTEVLGIDPAINFGEKLNALKDGGWIGDTERDVLGVVTDAGNAAAHRGWEPSGREIAALLDAMEVFLQRAFIVGKEALGIKASIPPKPQRQQAAPGASVASNNPEKPAT